MQFNIFELLGEKLFEMLNVSIVEVVLVQYRVKTAETSAFNDEGQAVSIIVYWK